MNQALAFGLLLAGGVVLEAGLTGKGLGAVLSGQGGSIPNTGSALSGGVAGVGSAISNAVANAAGVLDPIPGFSIGRTDMGVDATASPGQPIIAPAASELVGVVSNWYQGQPLLLFKFLNPPAGAASPYWYAAEQVNPVTTQVGTVFQQGQPVAHYASSGTGVELGWGSPTSTSRTLAGAQGQAWEANPGGQTTPTGSSFEHYFSLN